MTSLLVPRTTESVLESVDKDSEEESEMDFPDGENTFTRGESVKDWLMEGDIMLLPLPLLLRPSCVDEICRLILICRIKLRCEERPRFVCIDSKCEDVGGSFDRES
jgi:hypothetical protein